MVSVEQEKLVENVQETNSSPKPADSRRANVRLTKEQYARLKEESELTGLGFATLLKKSHFERAKLHPLLSERQQKSLFSELRRMGNDINQIAKKVNGGALEGWHKELANMITILNGLKAMVAGVYGAR